MLSGHENFPTFPKTITMLRDGGTNCATIILVLTLSVHAIKCHEVQWISLFYRPYIRTSKDKWSILKSVSSIMPVDKLSMFLSTLNPGERAIIRPM